MTGIRCTWNGRFCVHFFDDDDPFLLWLKDEGFKVELFGHSNVDNAIYVNINSNHALNAKCQYMRLLFMTVFGIYKG